MLKKNLVLIFFLAQGTTENLLTTKISRSTVLLVSGVHEPAMVAEELPMQSFMQSFLAKYIKMIIRPLQINY